MTPGPFAVSARRWGPYALAGVLLLLDYTWLARGLSHTTDGRVYSAWSLDHRVYSDVIWLGLTHYAHGLQFVHPLPYVHDRIEYPVLLGFTLWLPALLPGGPASWLAAAGILTAAATFGSIALVRRQRASSAWWIAASPALLLDAGINWDLIGILFLVGAVVWFGERRYRLGLGTAWPRVRADAESAFSRFDFPCPPFEAPLRTLSGGNVQRVVMARELANRPRLVVALYPTRGLDVHSAQAVRDKLYASAAEGAAVLLVSEDLDEILELADRVAVMSGGTINYVAPVGETDRSTIGKHMAGH